MGKRKNKIERARYAKYQREARKRLKALGFVEFRAWVHPEDRERMRLLARHLNDQRQESES